MFVSTISPLAFALGPLEVRWYGVLFSGGFIIGYFMMQYFFRRKHYATADLDQLLVYLFIGTVIGARLGHCFFYEPDFYLSHPLEILKIWKGGLASHGGTIGVMLSIYLFVRKKKYGFLELADMLSIPIALVCVMIRLGNFCNAEILGIPSAGDYGVIFASLGEDFPRHPVQLYEAAAYLGTFMILLCCYLKIKTRGSGFITGELLVLVFLARMLIEPYKLEQADYDLGLGLNLGALLSIPFVLLGLYLMYRSFKRQPA
ncbi:MAG: prolipoprotein diacylglyceryl transferase [Succinivibrio sp.]|nr:prolipoprotein diacylglyceryl transferase [Succinivibrio sp.]